MPEFPIIHITPNPENDKLITYFLKQVYNYYPVGFCHFRKTYPGFAEIGKIVGHKFDVECNDAGATCNVFVEQLKRELPAYIVSNQNHLHFPNYSATVLVSSVDNDILLQETFIEVYISLLCDYYTVFIVDFYRFKKRSTQNNSIKHHHSIHSLNEIHGEQYNKEVGAIKKLVHRYFPQKQFISHVFLTRYRIQSVEPFNEDNCPHIDARAYNFFDLLFDFRFRTDDIKILE